MNLLRDMAICQLDWQQCNFDFLVVHFPNLTNISPSTTVIRWQSKTVSDVELQNFIPEQASHHFVFCYRKLDWQRVEFVQVLRMMAHLNFKFEEVRSRRTKNFLFGVRWETKSQDKSTGFDFVLLANPCQNQEQLN